VLLLGSCAAGRPAQLAGGAEGLPATAPVAGSGGGPGRRQRRRRQRRRFS